MAADGALLPPLTCAVVVCRVRPRVAALAHVVHILSDFLDVSLLLRFDEACALPSLYQAQRIIARDSQEPANSSRRDPTYRQWRFTRGLPKAVAAGDLRLVQWLLESFPECYVPSRTVGEAARHGRLEILQWLQAQDRDLHVSGDEVGTALHANHADVVMWLVANVPSSTREGPQTNWPEAAAANGNLNMVRWSLQLLADSWQGFRRTETAIQMTVDTAAEAGQSFILEWILNDDEMKKLACVKLARVAAGGHFGVMQWLWCHYRTHLFAKGAMDEAARIGRLDIVTWLRERNLGTWEFDSLNEAAGNGHLDMVKWLHEHQAEADPQQEEDTVASETSLSWGEPLLKSGTKAMDAAASGGHLDVVRWLHENRTEGCSTAAMDGAAAQGHLEVVQWLHENRSEGCSKAAMNGAARNGHLKVVRWLHANRSEGCSKSAMNSAARGGHLKVVQWLHTNRTEGCNEDAMDGGAKGGHLEVVQWLHANRSEGCTTNAMDVAAGGGDLELVRWLHLNRSEGCTVRAMDRAAAAGHFDVIIFLHQERSEGCSRKVVFGARRSGLLPWFERHYSTH